MVETPQEEFENWFRRGVDGKPLGDANSRQREYYRLGALARSNQHAFRRAEEIRQQLQIQQQQSIPRGVVPLQLTPAPTKLEDTAFAPKKPTQIELERQQSLPPELRQQQVFLERRQVDTFRPEGSIREVPITKTFVVSEAGETLREASPEEQRQFRQGTRVLQASELKAPPKIVRRIEEAGAGVGRRVEEIASRRPVSSIADFTLNTEEFVLRAGGKFTELPLEKKQEIRQRKIGANVFATTLFLTTPAGLRGARTISRLDLVGVEQRTKGRIIQTDILATTPARDRLIIARGLTKGKATGVKGQIFKEKTTEFASFKKVGEFAGRQISKAKKGVLEVSKEGKGLKVSRKVPVDVQFSIGEVGVSRRKALQRRIITPRGVETKKDILIRKFTGTGLSAGRKIRRIGATTLSIKGQDIFIGRISGKIKKLPSQKRELFEITGKATEDPIELSILKGKGLKARLPETIQEEKALQDVLSVTSQADAKIISPKRPFAPLKTESELKTPSLKTELETDAKEVLLQKPREVIAPKTKTREAQRIGQRERQIPREAQRTSQLLTQKQLTKPEVKAIQKISPAQSQRIRQRFRIVSRARARTPIRITAPLLTSKPIVPVTPSFKAKPRTQKVRDKFRVSVLFGEKFRPIATGRTLREALEIGTGFTGRTIKRTFKVEPERRKAFDVPTPFGFRRSRRKEPEFKGAFVEKSKTALSQIGEQRAVQFGRKIKRARRKELSILS